MTKPYLIKALEKAEQLAQIASDWNLGTNGQIEIDGEWVRIADLRDEFRDAITGAKEDK